MRRALRRALGVLLGALVRVWLSTLRFSLVIDPALAGSASAASELPWILALWHGQQMLLLRWPRRRRTIVLVSLSRDGDLLAGALPVLGCGVERGSTSRGGAGGLRSIVRRLRSGCDAAFAVDGPKGPRRSVRALGASAAASLAGGVVVPLAAACSASWVLSRTWDRFELPRPFSRVAVALGAPLDPEAASSPSGLAEAVESARAVAEEALKQNDRTGRRAVPLAPPRPL
ncbi:MAG TPA: DUF374 domain-containing protein [Polyangiaceae bacterium]|jgi:hypothetical protein|nr:DUF374 domain-containing protein [Polyangiaceae bacterium]